MKFCKAHNVPLCRTCNRQEKPAFGTVRKPLANKKREQTRMSAEAEVQPDVAGRCLLLGFMPGDCGVKVHRCHIVSQQTIRDTYPLGAWRYVGDEFWRPVSNRDTLDVLEDIERLTLQQILDDNRNFVHGCENHNLDGLKMVDALDARKVAGVPSYPAGFGEFTHQFRFSIEGATYWYYVPLVVAA